MLTSAGRRREIHIRYFRRQAYELRLQAMRARFAIFIYDGVFVHANAISFKSALRQIFTIFRGIFVYDIYICACQHASLHACCRYASAAATYARTAALISFAPMLTRLCLEMMKNAICAIASPRISDRFTHADLAVRFGTFSARRFISLDYFPAPHLHIFNYFEIHTDYFTENLALISIHFEYFILPAF